MTPDLKAAVEYFKNFKTGSVETDIQLDLLIDHATRQSEMVEVLKGVRDALQTIQNPLLAMSMREVRGIAQEQLSALNKIIEGE